MVGDGGAVFRFGVGFYECAYVHVSRTIILLWSLNRRLRQKMEPNEVKKTLCPPVKWGNFISGDRQRLRRLVHYRILSHHNDGRAANCDQGRLLT